MRGLIRCAPFASFALAVFTVASAATPAVPLVDDREDWTPFACLVQESAADLEEDQEGLLDGTVSTDDGTVDLESDLTSSGSSGGQEVAAGSATFGPCASAEPSARAYCCHTITRSACGIDTSSGCYRNQYRRCMDA